jgi:hypothetical protein
MTEQIKAPSLTGLRAKTTTATPQAEYPESALNVKFCPYLTSNGRDIDPVIVCTLHMRRVFGLTECLRSREGTCDDKL